MLLPVNSRLLVVKFSKSQKLYINLLPCRGLAPLTPMLFKGQLDTHAHIYAQTYLHVSFHLMSFVFWACFTILFLFFVCNLKILKGFTLKFKNRKGCLMSSFLFNFLIKILHSSILEIGKIKGIEIRKLKGQLLSLIDFFLTCLRLKYNFFFFFF